MFTRIKLIDLFNWAVIRPSIFNAVAAGVGVGLGIYSVYSSAKAAEEAGDAAAAAQIRAAESADKQFDISQQQIDLAKEQWDLYKTEIYPMEIKSKELGLEYEQLGMQQYKDFYKPLGDQFAKDAMEGVEAQPERAARDARLSVDQQFDSEEGMMQRNLERRGVRPDSGNYESGASNTGLNRAAAKGYAVNRAIEGERDRVEDVNFNRKASALGRTPIISGGNVGMSPGLATQGMGAAGNTAAGAGNTYANIAGMYNNNAARYGNNVANTISGGIQLGSQAYDVYNKYNPSTSTVPTYANTPAAPTNPMAPVSTNVNTGFNTEGFALAEGGEVNTPPSFARSGGQINGPEGTDQIQTYVQAPDGTKAPASISDGEFIIPADVKLAVGTDYLNDIIEKAREKKQQLAQGPNTLQRRTR